MRFFLAVQNELDACTSYGSFPVICFLLFFFYYFVISSSVWKYSHVSAEGVPLIWDAADWIWPRSREPVVRSAATGDDACEAIAIMRSRASSSQKLGDYSSHKLLDVRFLLAFVSSMRCQAYTFKFPPQKWNNETDRYHSRCRENVHREKILHSPFRLFWH